MIGNAHAQLTSKAPRACVLIYLDNGEKNSSYLFQCPQCKHTSTVSRPHAIAIIRPTRCMPMLTVTRHHQCPMPPCCKAHCYKASMPLCSRLTVIRHHQCPMPPCCKAHCCKVSSVSYASLLQGPLPAYLVSVVCVIIVVCVLYP